MTDWLFTFRPAVLAFLNGGDPYAYIFNVPWVLFPLIPFAVFSEVESIYLLLFAELVSFFLVARRFTRNRWWLAVWLLNPFTVFSVLVGNVEWLCLLGFIAQPFVGWLLLMVKPQLTAGVIVFSLMENLFRKRYSTLFSQMSAIGCTGFYLFMATPFFERLSLYSSFQDTAMNYSLGAIGWPIGLGLLAMAFRFRRPSFSMLASPFLFSVVTLGCYTVVPLGLIRLMRKAPHD